MRPRSSLPPAPRQYCARAPPYLSQRATTTPHATAGCYTCKTKCAGKTVEEGGTQDTRKTRERGVPLSVTSPGLLRSTGPQKRRTKTPRFRGRLRKLLA